MEDLLDPEEKIVCPYDSVHLIRRCRMAVHLTKCKKNHPSAEMVSCPFNSLHRIPRPELQYHQQVCSDRHLVETQILENRSRIERNPIVQLDLPCDENWDDYNCSSYDPKKYVEKNEIFRTMDVAPPSQKKQFAMEERRRFREISEQNSNYAAATASKNKMQKPSTSSSSVNSHLEGKVFNLPDHRKVTSIQDDPEDLLQKVKKGAGKLYIPE